MHATSKVRCFGTWVASGQEVTVALTRLVKVVSDPFQKDSFVLKSNSWSDLCKCVRKNWRWGTVGAPGLSLSQKPHKRARVDDEEVALTSAVCVLWRL